MEPLGVEQWVEVQALGPMERQLPEAETICFAIPRKILA
jgi:hypothetical protein